ncbi:unnamed protein product [Amoebophrya sp. A25]|nr:unnamed protein product [Amoebophrya sp. A25]|eukprot:GSA25T00000161001.1
MKIDVRCEPREALEARKMQVPAHRQKGFVVGQPIGHVNKMVRDYKHKNFHTTAEKEPASRRWLEPHGNAIEGGAEMTQFFVEKLQNGYELERTQAHGPTIMTAKSIESPWDAAVQKYSPGLKGDFHDPTANRGYGRTPSGNVFTNFR